MKVLGVLQSVHSGTRTGVRGGRTSLCPLRPKLVSINLHRGAVLITPHRAASRAKLEIDTPGKLSRPHHCQFDAIVRRNIRGRYIGGRTKENAPGRDIDRMPSAAADQFAAANNPILQFGLDWIAASSAAVVY